MTVSSQQPGGSLSAALAHAERLLARDPVLTELQAREILKVVPEQPEALRLLGVALRAQGRNEEAAGALEKLIQQQPRSAAAQFQHGLALADLGKSDGAIAALRQAVHFDPRHPQAWRALGDQFTLAGDVERAQESYARHIKASVNDPQLLEAAAALCDGKLAVAERLLREFLKAHPTDVAAIRMLAEIGARLGRTEDAEALLSRCLELAPEFVEARHNYGLVLHRQNKGLDALRELDRLLKSDPRNPGYRALKAAILGRIGEYGQSIDIYTQLLKEHPAQPSAWMSYGHALKTVGRAKDAIAAYRRSIQLMPDLGEAYWSLANLKTFRFTPEDVEAMRAQLARIGLPEEDRVHLHFALGKALEDSASYAESFTEYERGNALRRDALHYDPEEITGAVRRSITLFTREFFAARANYGAPASDPIFIVGLTRSGSTLLEQILASHSAVEGTMELPDILSLARRFGRKSKNSDTPPYPLGLEALTREESCALGEEYLARTRIQRKTERPHFIDKMPNNWVNIGLIQLILPNARIIDARRHPLACCFSNYKQLFARGQGYSYSLADCGRYYRECVELMAHWDDVLPDRVHRVIHEELVRDPVEEVRKLLAYCGLEFEPEVLRFHENRRAVRTASSEQVRQPISSEAVDYWKNFEPWLGPLKDSLGPVLTAYPEAPPKP
jgi:tetratricopeptide (TPR) repeat protein